MPHWRVEIRGNDQDLDYLARVFTTGSPRIERKEHAVYLLADEFETMTGNRQVTIEAESMISRLNGIAMVIDPAFQPVELAGAERVHEDGRRDLFLRTEPGRIRLRGSFNATVIRSDGTVEKPSPTRAERIRDTATMNKGLAKALKLLSGGHDWNRLYKIHELIQRNVGQPSLIEKKGWATVSEVRRFSQTANWEKTPGGRHAVSKPKQSAPEDSMPLSEARNLILRMVGRWADELHEGGTGKGLT